MNANPNRNWPVSPHHQPAQPAYARPQAARAVKSDVESETWHVQVAAGDVRVVDLDKLDDLFRFEVIDENAFVWQTGMEKWSRLGDLLGIVEEEPEQPFHVLFSPGNVRVLTLDELNNFYQHEIVDESTLIWQKGMSEWQTLGKAAGIDEAVLPLRDAATSSVPTQVWNASTTLPPRTASAAPMPHPALAPAALTRGTPPVTVPGQAKVPTVVNAAPPNPRPPAAILQVAPSAPFSTRPVSLSIEPYPLKPAPKSGRLLLRLAVAAGLVLALLRNDLVHAALDKSPALAQYEQAERSLFGGPAFGTTRSVEQLVASCGGHLEPVHLPLAVTQFADAQKRGPGRDEKREAVVDNAPSKESSNRESSNRESSSPASPARVTSSSSANTSSASSGHATPAKSTSDTSRAVSSALSGAKPTHVSRPSKPRPSSSKPASKSGMKSSGSYYDPLNGAL